MGCRSCGGSSVEDSLTLESGCSRLVGVWAGCLSSGHSEVCGCVCFWVCVFVVFSGLVLDASMLLKMTRGKKERREKIRDFIGLYMPEHTLGLQFQLLQQ